MEAAWKALAAHHDQIGRVHLRPDSSIPKTEGATMSAEQTAEIAAAKRVMSPTRTE